MIQEKNNKKGFTLAELLIVVAIIGVLVAVSIPIFTAQLRKSRLATNQANARAGYAEAIAAQLDTDADAIANAVYTYDVSAANLADTGAEGDAFTGEGSATNTNISSWTVDSTFGSTKLGDKTFESFSFTFDANGEEIVAITAK